MVSAVDVTLTGAYNCDLEVATQGEVSVSLFDIIVATSAPLPDTAMCMCANCGSLVTASHKLPHPEAIAGGSRELWITAKQQRLCLSAVHVAVRIVVELPTPTRATPSLLAAAGGTLVTVHGVAFREALVTWCEFVGASGTRTQATWVSSQVVTCMAPKYPFPVIPEGNPVNVSLVVSYSLPDTTAIV
jgi:hypothetical protein